jgi:CelD/BcsL family acetyltransferase involved in cellulose biosynthesis
MISPAVMPLRRREMPLLAADSSVASSIPSCGPRQRREDRELARRFNQYGGHLTDDIERRLFEEMIRNFNFRV